MISLKNKTNHLKNI